MDANQQRFWLLAEAADWSAPEFASPTASAVEFDADCHRLRLRDRRPTRTAPGVVHAAQRDALLLEPARARDAYGTQAWWDNPTSTLMTDGGGGTTAGPLPLWPLAGETLAAGTVVTDLALGHDDVLYLAVQVQDAGGTVQRAFVGMLDRRGRWTQPRVREVELAGFVPQRLAARPQGGVWVLDRRHRRVAVLQGHPLRDGQPPVFRETTFRPVEENIHPPRLTELTPRPVWAEATEVAVDLAASPNGALALLSRRANGDSFLQGLEPEAEAWSAPRRLVDAGEAVSLAWLSAARLVVLPSPRDVGGDLRLPREALAYDPGDDTAELLPAGGFLPLRNLGTAVLVQGPTLPPHYLTRDGELAALVPLSVATYERAGAVESRVLDSGQDGTTWHRLYLEAIFPPGCGVVLELAADDDREALEDQPRWHRHEFGDVPSDATTDPSLTEVPELSRRPSRGAWLPDLSELPHHPGVLGRPVDPGRAGLFTALVQRPGRTVRALRGRHLRVRTQLHGTGHTTPELAAARVYASRFSYRDRYLPELYREERFGADADAAGVATGADFLDRFLALFESVLTPLEDRVAAAHVLTHPRATPDESLEWLASWIGATLDPLLPADRRRAWLTAAPRLHQTRGTLAGLQLALEIATGGEWRRTFDEEAGREVEYAHGGGVSGGEILVLEDFRLRRTFATILGANLSLPEDPLLPGLLVSAHSRVGDTLFLAETEKVELLALFRDAFSSDPTRRANEESAVREFYARLAHRVTIFVHDAVEPVDLGLIQRVVERETPAHLATQVVRASYPLLVGLASLVDVDTYLGPRPQPGVVRTNRTRLGEGDFVRRVASLDPRLSGARTAERADRRAPVARATGPESVEFGAAVRLSGAESRAAAGASLRRFEWRPLPPIP